MEVVFIKIEEKGIEIEYSETVPKELAISLVEECIKEHEGENYHSFIVTDDGEYITVCPRKKSIVRLRRITGYLSNVNNFNYAKKEEEHDRVKHLR